MFARWTSPGDVFSTLNELSRGQPCDFTGITDYRMIDDRAGIQWPYPDDCRDTTPQRRLFADGRFFHADGRAKFIFDTPREMPEPPNASYPYLLLTGRGTASQWHTQTRTAKSAVLRRLYPNEPYVEMHPVDARREHVRPHQQVVVQSQRGEVTARALVTPTVQPGQVFMAMHYEGTNRLTLSHFDPHSRQPAYKSCAVRITPVGVQRY
jgi:assimilatory nitrate reductase catalytic subunit